MTLEAPYCAHYAQLYPLPHREGRGGSSVMKESTKKTWKRVFDIIVTILTALVTSLTTTSCMTTFSF